MVLLVCLPRLASRMAEDCHARRLAGGVPSEKDVIIWAICELNGSRSSSLVDVGRVPFGVVTALGEDRLVRDSPFCWYRVRKQHIIARWGPHPI